MAPILLSTPGARIQCCAFFLSRTLALLFAAVVIHPAAAVTTNWALNGGGSFTNAANWSAGVPGSADTANFNRNANIQYNVTFPGRPITSPLTRQVDHLLVGTNVVSFSDSVNFNQLPAALSVAPVVEPNEHALVIGNSSGQTAELQTALSSFSTTSATLGRAASSSGVLRVTNGVFNVTGNQVERDELIVGDFGTGLLEVTGGADVISSANAVVGRQSGGVGTANISGAGSTWAAESLSVLRGSVNVSAGGNLTGFGAKISGANAAVSISGMDSTWSTTGFLQLELGGSLNIQSGGQVSTPSVSVGMLDRGLGQIEVTGVGSILAVSNTSSSNFAIGGQDSSTGRLTVRNGAIVTSGPANLGRAFSFNPLEESEGTVVVEGSGSQWILTGGLFVDPLGTNTISVLAGGRISAMNIIQNVLGTIFGTGTIAAPNTINLGLISPGTSAGSPGTLRIEGALTQSVLDGIFGQIDIELGGPNPATEFDRLVVTGGLTLDGTLNVSLINGFTPAFGQTFDILDGASFSGTFDSLELPLLSPELTWDASRLYTTGELRVVKNLPGDYNADGVVDAADYTTWRDNFGLPIRLPNDLSPFSVNSNDHLVWRTNFGAVRAKFSYARCGESSRTSGAGRRCFWAGFGTRPPECPASLSSAARTGLTR